ncbi:hypothetical protein B4U79_09716 [Dinothrombium tinctorium]|uniref:Uncharacterized protein n=1 Tax=Dinothrombium tinctorium TaxID=1965070 RepID=A0A3S3P0K8_9ACAR|nr:hypothetical protein B4U79_09716 [Dinothrombium tinctorium]
MNSVASKVGENSRKCVHILKHILITSLFLALVFEILWTVYICKAFKDDIKTYEKDAIWIKEFYKSTRNFFVFTVILVSLTAFIGFAAAYAENKALMILFVVAYVMEWGFELIGVYASDDHNVVVYKLICQALKPFILLLSLIFICIIKEGDEELLL